MTLFKILFTHLILFSLSTTTFSAKVDTVKVHSQKMEKGVKVVTIVPETKKKDKNKLFPVIILLHGFSDDHSTWIKRVPALTSLADQYQFIIVCPDGNYGCWYMDSKLGNKDFYYENFITKDLIPFVNEKLPSVKEKKGRFITGLSMGGFGALYLAIRNPDLFSTAASLSGAFDLTQRTKNSQHYLETYILGDSTNNLSVYKEHSVVNMGEDLKKSGMEIYISCGLSDFVLNENRDFHQKLQALNVPHFYIERKGAHTWDYWRDNIEEVIIFFKQHLNHNQKD